MAGLKEVRIRIQSVISTQQITKAMKMVSAAKLRRAQEAIIQLRPYALKVKEILGHLSANLDDANLNVFGKERDVNKLLLVVINSNRGLCGSFNSGIIKKAKRIIEKDFATQQSAGNIHIMCIGKKGFEYFTKYKYKVVGHHNELYTNIQFEKVSEVAKSLMIDYTSAKYDKIILVYNQFKNAATQIITGEQFLPIVKPTTLTKEQHDDLSHPKNHKQDYIFEPSAEEIVNELIPKSLKIQLYRAILESNAAEHGSRMTAMDKATENASDLLKNLKLTYNKARQATITKEILEIAGGAEALSN